MQDYYNYWILDPRKPGKYEYEGLNFCFLFEPFYTGMSHSKARFARHLYDAIKGLNLNPRKNNKISKIIKVTNNNPYFLITIKNLSREDSTKIEKSYIKIVGRLDQNTGPLTNLTDGGSGTPITKISEEHKHKLREKSTGRKMTPQNYARLIDRNLNNNPMKGKFGQLHHRFGITHSKESREKIKKNHAKCDGKNNSKAKSYIFSNGEETFLVEGEFEKFCEDNNLPISIMYRIYRKMRNNKYYKGWTVEEIKPQSS